MKIVLQIALALVLTTFTSAQQAALRTPEKQINTTDPPNLSWVVGEFTISSMENGAAVLAPIKQPLLPPTIEVKYSSQLTAQYPKFKQNATVTLVIREGWVSQVFTE